MKYKSKHFPQHNKHNSTRSQIIKKKLRYQPQQNNQQQFEQQPQYEEEQVNMQFQKQEQNDHNQDGQEQQQIGGNQEEQDNGEREQNILEENERNLEQYQQEIGNRGVIYMSRIPPYMTPSFIRKLLKNYEVERIYLLPESEWARKNRIKNGGSKRICFREGWIEFTDKKQAKMVALTLNGQKMVGKKGSFYSEDVWNLKYLSKFKWHHLTQKLAHEERIKKERLKLEMEQERKLQEYYTTQVHKSKTIGGIVKSKLSKGRQVKAGNFRNYSQRSAIGEAED